MTIDTDEKGLASCNRGASVSGGRKNSGFLFQWSSHFVRNFSLLFPQFYAPQPIVDSAFVSARQGNISGWCVRMNFSNLPENFFYIKLISALYKPA